MGKHTSLGSAKRDDPIYSSGLMVHFKPPLTPSTSDTLEITDGELPQGPKPKEQSNSAQEMPRDIADGMYLKTAPKSDQPSATATPQGAASSSDPASAAASREPNKPA